MTTTRITPGTATYDTRGFAVGQNASHDHGGGLRRKLVATGADELPMSRRCVGNGPAIGGQPGCQPSVSRP